MSSNIILFVVNNIIFGINDITNDIDEYFNYKVGVQAIEMNGILDFTRHCYGEISKNFTHCFQC